MPGYYDLRPIRACRILMRALSSSGPWLRQRLFCPPASSLTMATSELLPTTVGLCLIPTALWPTEGPQFTPLELDSVPLSLLRWFQHAAHELASLAWPSPILSGLGNHSSPHTGLRVACFTKRQHSLNAARNLASPAPDGRFTTELACGRSSFRTSVMTT